MGWSVAGSRRDRSRHDHVSGGWRCRCCKLDQLPVPPSYQHVDPGNLQAITFLAEFLGVGFNKEAFFERGKLPVEKCDRAAVYRLATQSRPGGADQCFRHKPGHVNRPCPRDLPTRNGGKRSNGRGLLPGFSTCSLRHAREVRSGCKTGFVEEVEGNVRVISPARWRH